MRAFARQNHDPRGEAITRMAQSLSKYKRTVGRMVVFVAILLSTNVLAFMLGLYLRSL